MVPLGPVALAPLWATAPCPDNFSLLPEMPTLPPLDAAMFVPPTTDTAPRPALTESEPASLALIWSPDAKTTSPLDADAAVLTLTPPLRADTLAPL